MNNPPGPPPGQGAPVNPICPRLEAQLATIDRGGSTDPAKDEQIRRYQDAAAKQQGELDRVTMQAKRMGCDSSGFFSLFNGQSAQCSPVNNQIQQMRANLDMTNGLVVSEAVMMGLGPRLGREYAHDLVYDICREAVRQRRPLLELLLENKEITSAMSRSAGSIGSFTGCPLIRMVPPEVRLLRLAGLKKRNAP
jgi:hypothetical protein